MNVFFTHCEWIPDLSINYLLGSPSRRICRTFTNISSIISLIYQFFKQKTIIIFNLLMMYSIGLIYLTSTAHFKVWQIHLLIYILFLHECQRHRLYITRKYNLGRILFLYIMFEYWLIVILSVLMILWTYNK